MTDDVSPAPDGQPLRFALHHAGQLVADIPAAATELVRCFGYVVESAIIEDPVQTALVQFLRLPGSGCWLELIAPNSPGSKLSRSLEKGGGLHHLCYEVDQIESACDHLRDQKMIMLSRPQPAVAFAGRRIAWFCNQAGHLVELVETGEGPLSLRTISA